MMNSSILRLIASICLVALPACACASTAAEQQPTPVKNFELERYLGTWHQLALIPMSFQKQCVRNTTATYSKADDGLVVVRNRCLKDSGEESNAEARARKNSDYDLDSTLEVTFVSLLGKWLWLAAGDYWVIDLDADYQTAIVGHPEYSYGWILSREPTITLERYKKLGASLTKQGYDTCKFEMSSTPAQDFPAKTRLCDYLKKD